MGYIEFMYQTFKRHRLGKLCPYVYRPRETTTTFTRTKTVMSIYLFIFLYCI